MAVITGGNIVRGGVTIAGGRPRTFASNGAPVAGTTYAGTVVPGDLVYDTANGNLYEYTEPLVGTTATPTPTYTRVDTV
jgi:hypothetical protein